jgi:uncharacterized membrane protein YeaQ/YmgE (transglycosylase-associated protein family)
LGEENGAPVLRTIWALVHERHIRLILDFLLILYVLARAAKTHSNRKMGIMMEIFLGLKSACTYKNLLKQFSASVKGRSSTNLEENGVHRAVDDTMQCGLWL